LAEGVVRIPAVVGADPIRRRVSLEMSADPKSPAWSARASAKWLRVVPLAGAIEIEADPAGLGPGLYVDTVALVEHRSGRVRDRLEVVLEVAQPGRATVVARDLPWSWGLAASGRTLIHASYGWDLFGLRPRPRLLRMTGGDVAPRTLARLPAEALYAPTAAPDGGAYVLARANGRNWVYRVEADGRAAVLSAQPGEEAAYGLASLQDGSLLMASWSGRIVRIEPDGRSYLWADLGRATYQIAADHRSNVYAALLSGDVMKVDPAGHTTVLETGFVRGRLVAVTASEDGRVFAAERGAAGRVVEVGAAGPKLVARVPGGEFYGLAVSGDFLYALDLGHRQMVRIPIAGPGARILAKSPLPSAPSGGRP
jgi:hypothetical protein